MNQLVSRLCVIAVLFLVGGVPTADGRSESKPKPVALVLSITNAPAAEVQPYQHLFSKDKIDLRPAGVMRVSYLNTCVEETITGGKVKFNDIDRKLSKGAKAETFQIDCHRIFPMMNCLHVGEFRSVPLCDV